MNLIERQRRVEERARESERKRNEMAREKREQELARRVAVQRVKEFERRSTEDRKNALRHHWDHHPISPGIPPRRLKHQEPPKIYNIDDDEDKDLHEALVASLGPAKLSKSPKPRPARKPNDVPISDDDDMNLVNDDEDEVLQEVVRSSLPTAVNDEKRFEYISSEDEDEQLQRAVSLSLKDQTRVVDLNQQQGQPPQQPAVNKPIDRTLPNEESVEDNDVELQDALLFSLQRSQSASANSGNLPVITSVDDDEDNDTTKESPKPPPNLLRRQGSNHVHAENEHNYFDSEVYGSYVRPHQFEEDNTYQQFLQPPRYQHQRDEDPATVYNRQIRKEQDLAYEMSLAEDREKERKAKRAQELEMAKEMAHKALLEKRENAGSLLPPEPQEGKGISLGIRVPSGARFFRRFDVTNTLQDLRNFIESKANEIKLAEQYEISSDFPKRTFHDKPISLTLEEAGINGRMLFNIQEIKPKGADTTTTTTSTTTNTL